MATGAGGPWNYALLNFYPTKGPKDGIRIAGIYISSANIALLLTEVLKEWCNAFKKAG